MQTIRTKTRVTFAPGLILALSIEQSSIRAHNLEDLGGGRFRVVNEVEFRQDEELGFEGEITPPLHQVVEVFDKALEDMEQPELLAMARGLGLNPHPNTGPAKLIEAIKLRQDEMLAEQEEAEKKAARIADLESRLDTLDEAELAELETLTMSGN